MTGEYRNHPSVLLEVAARLGASFLFLFLVVGRLQVILPLFGIVFIALMTYSIAVWKHTCISFEETELIVHREMKLIKSDKRIQYSRLASVSATRSLINRIFGTMRLRFNLNSSVDADRSEATLTVKIEVAEAIRCELNSKIFSESTDAAEESEVESLVVVSNTDIIIHSFISQPTSRLLFAVLMLVYSILSIVYRSTSGLIIPMILLIANEIVPLIKEVLAYCNYRIYRVGDTITVESGLITTVRRSFKVGKVNSIRLRQPLIARVFGLAVLDAEVVGLTVDSRDSAFPLLCPLKKESEVRSLMVRILLEVVFEPESISQSRGALMAMGLVNVFYACIAVVLSLFLLISARPTIGGMDNLSDAILLVTGLFVAIGLPLLLAGHVVLAQRNRRFALGPESFMMVNGGYDTSSEFILYDKVQYADVRSGPIQRRFATAVLDVGMMSSGGFRAVRSGLFPPQELELVPSEVIDRICDGRYDYRKYE